MLWINSKKHSWRAACSKSLLVVFIAQILLSAACISSANAATLQSMDMGKHCHSMAMDQATMKHHVMPPCSHCDTPDMSISNHAPMATDMVPVLLAMITLPEVNALSISAASHFVTVHAPPHSSTLLYQTTQRILI